MLLTGLKLGEGLLLNIGNENIMIVVTRTGPRKTKLATQASSKVKVTRLTSERVKGLFDVEKERNK